MKKWLSLCLCMACLLSLLAGCGGEVTIQQPENGQKATKSEVTKVADSLRGSRKEVLEDGHKKFKADGDPDVKIDPSGLSNLERAKLVFSKIDSEDGNTLYSPLSLEMALGLLSEGATGETRAQILSFLGVGDAGFSVTAEAIIAHAEEVTHEAEEDPELTVFGDYSTALNIANSLWADKKYTLKHDFLRVAKDSYKATSETLDFSKPDESAQTVNNWCSETTKGLINKVLSPDMITEDLALILCNSVYFESGWWNPWDEGEGEFALSDGKKVAVPDFLYSTESTYYETDNAVAFGKGYVNGSTFIGILPDEDVSLADIDLDALLASKSTEYDVHASMPKLDYEYSNTDLVNILSSCGVVNMFSPVGELGGLVNESNDIYVSDVIQKCKVELDENGTKAAAVTAMMMADNAVMLEDPTPVKEVHLNRPFYYMIMDGDTVLFIGAVNTVEGTHA